MKENEGNFITSFFFFDFKRQLHLRIALINETVTSIINITTHYKRNVSFKEESKSESYDSCANKNCEVHNE